MKKTLLILVTVLTATLTMLADVTINSTNFPDANFRSYLLSEYPSGVITTAQLNARDSLELMSKRISNIKGVEYFTQLTYLSCYSNYLTSVDVSHNTKLKYLNLAYNALTSINVSANTLLEQLYLQNNSLVTVSANYLSNLRTLWVFNNTNLTTLNCQSNNLTNFDVGGCTALQTLKCFYNDNLTTIKGLADCTALTYLDCEDCAIADISAVSGMANLQTLWARNNKLTELNVANKHSLSNLRVSGNKQLTALTCYSCNLTTLNVTGCTALENLKCYYNANLTAINGLVDCTALTYLDCEDCAITSLPGVNNMANLQSLWARNNQLSGSFEVSNKPNLKYLRVSGNTGLTHLRCAYDALTSLDVTGCTGLNFIDCEVNPNLTSVSGLTTCTALEHFGGDVCAFTSLDMTFCPGLQVLYCYNNQLTSLNVTGLTDMVFLNCMNNPNLGEITGLSGCTSLTYLECSNCGLTELNVNRLSKLQELWCRNNLFTQLEMYNKPHLTKLYATNNQLLEDIYCFSDALVVLEVSNCPALYYIDCQDNQLTELNVRTCPSLMYLLFNENQLTELDISNNPELFYLWCNRNNLTSLDLSQCSDDFRSLDCRYNQISGTIDVSRFNNLYQLAIDVNEISQLILGDHPMLKDLWCSHNRLSGTLDVSGFSSLETFTCGQNYLSGVRAEDCPKLHDAEIMINNVKAPKMGQFVTDLPTWPADNMGSLFAISIDYEGYTEGNVMTAAQVNEAHAKGWNVYYYNEEEEGWFPYAGSAFILGDVNDDGNVNIADVTALINMVLSGNASVDDCPAGDINGDGNLNVADVTALINMVLRGTSGSTFQAAAKQQAAKSSPATFMTQPKELTLEPPLKHQP